ncbi:MAG: aminoacyl-tRNA hydrolase [Spirochaetales bacterium]|nr:aminoacyl-tRNA hydrolase [Spirochaetales bacterium]MBP7262970.1 aminoacyl-tRNA hydrolase [Spirochaetia bacterium]
MARLCVFLGNHGRKYRDNRHNVAWQFLASLEVYPSLSWQRGFKGSYAQLDLPSGRVWILTPETYMNLSGESAAELARFHKIEPADILVVHDELELGFGFFGFKMGGGLGGHNGLRSMKERLGTADFPRLRFGIGRPDHDDVAGYVLSDFGADQRELLACSVFPRARAAFHAYLDGGFAAVDQEFRKVNALA